MHLTFAAATIATLNTYDDQKQTYVILNTIRYINKAMQLPIEKHLGPTNNQSERP